MTNLYTKHLKSNADHVYLFIVGIGTDTPKAYIDYNLAKADANKQYLKINRFTLDDADEILHNRYFNQTIAVSDHLYIAPVEFTKFSSTNLNTLINYVISQSKYTKLIDMNITELSANKLKLSLKYYSTRTIDGLPIVDNDDVIITQMEIADIEQSNFNEQNYYDPEELLCKDVRDTLMMFLDTINDNRSADNILTNRNLAFDYTNLDSRFHKANSEDPLLMMISVLVRNALYDETDRVTASKVNDETIGMISAANHVFTISWYKERGIIDQFNDEDGNSATFRNAIDIIEELIDEDFLKHPFETYQKVMSEAF